MRRTLNQEWTHLERLLAPVSEQHPCGVWLHYEGTYEEVREARREDDPGLPQGVWQTELKRADWPRVEAICAEALEQKSKDLQIAAWLLEAWIQLDGFAGAARGLELIGHLCAEQWEDIFPVLQDDLGPRLTVFQWLNEKVSRRLRMVRLTQPEMEGVPAYALADWDVAIRNPSSSSADNGITVGKFEQSANLTPYRWFVELDHDLRKTQEMVQALEAFMDEKMGKQSSGLATFRVEVAAAAELTTTMLAAAYANLPEPPAQTETGLAADEVGWQPGHLELQTSWEDGMEQRDEKDDSQASGMRLGSRSDAYKLLEEIATYLIRNEPHSPTPYLIRKAIAWGNMRFDELLPELVKDRGELSEIMKLLGLNQHADKQK